MNDQILKEILRRLQRLEQTSVRYRAGEVTDVAPLDVALGGSDVSYEDVTAVGPLADGDQVATLLWGNDLLVLGSLLGGLRFGSASVTWPGGSPNATDTTVTHGLSSTPRCVLMTPTSSTNAVLSSSSVGSATFLASGTTRDGSSPVAATARSFYWLAIA